MYSSSADKRNDTHGEEVREPSSYFSLIGENGAIARYDKINKIRDRSLTKVTCSRHNQPLVKVARPSSFAPYTQIPWREAKADMESRKR